MRADRRSRAVRLAVAILLPGCALLTRPEGDGGWSVERRQEALEERATRAGVTLEPETAPVEAPPGGPRARRPRSPPAERRRFGALHLVHGFPDRPVRLPAGAAAARPAGADDRD